MVNLIAGRLIVPELMQNDMTPAKLSEAATDLLLSPTAADRMRADLAEVRDSLTSEGDPFERAACLLAGALAPIEAKFSHGELARETISSRETIS
jgi:lipid-A-disaccharide synthase